MNDKQFKLIYSAPLLLTQTPSRIEVRQTIWMFQRHREWFNREVGKYDIHHMISDLMDADRQNPLRHYIKDWREMILEWPHEPESHQHQGLNKIAFTQSQDKGERDIQTVTTYGKYLKRHMPDCPDHELRDFVSRYTVDPNSCKITTDLGKMIYIIQNGPPSCMKKQKWNDDTHPYNVYDPKYGWGMAYRVQGGKYWGRALVHIPTKTFVRAYKGDPESWNVGDSRDDEMLEAWLVNEGYDHDCAWNGQRLAKIENEYGEYLMPYLDGENKAVDNCGDYFELCRHGELSADGTEGVLEDNRRSCDDCGDSVDEDDLTHIGDYGHAVCESCLNDHYTHAWVSRHCTEWVSDDEVIYCESDGDYYHQDCYTDMDVVYCEDRCEYYKMEDAWLCEGSNHWYHLDTPCHEVDGCPYHEDYLPDGWELVDGVLREVETA